MRIPASGTVCMNATGEYSPRRYRRRDPRSLRHLRISNYGERSVSLEGGNFAVLTVLARNGIVGPVIPLRPAGVMTRYTGFRRVREIVLPMHEYAAYVKDPNGPQISLAVCTRCSDNSSDLNVDAMPPECPTNIYILPSTDNNPLSPRWSGDTRGGVFRAYK